MFVDLDSLPPEHPLRNTPLSQIKAEYQWIRTKDLKLWHRVTRSFRIGQETFNKLGSNWIGAYRWRVDDGQGTE